MDAMAVLLTLMLISVAGLGVLNSVVPDTRERIRDLGVCKAIGMSPRQTTSLVLASVTVIGVIGGLIGVSAGYTLHGIVMPVMGRAVGTTLPSSVLDVYGPVELLLLGPGGVVLAMLAGDDAGRLGGQGAYGHGAAHRVASGGARAAGADPPGPRGRASRTGTGADAPSRQVLLRGTRQARTGAGSGKRCGVSAVRPGWRASSSDPVSPPHRFGFCSSAEAPETRPPNRGRAHHRRAATSASVKRRTTAHGVR